MGAVIVYAVTAAVGLLCAGLLWRRHREAPSSLLRAAAICFAGLAFNDLGRILDVAILPDVSLIAVRSLPALAGVAVLVHALVKETAR